MNSRRVIFLSDLHLFAQRSDAQKHHAQIRNSIRGADQVILGGDIFDFRWSRFKCIDRSSQEALNWLTEIIQINQACRFEYVLGNHDCMEPFVDCLLQFSARCPRLSVHPYYYRSGSNLFLHGDVVNRRTTQLQLERIRSKWAVEESHPGDLRHKLYDAFVSTPLCRISTGLIFPTTSVLDRLNYYLNDIGQTPASGLKHVYFGHTHVPVHNVMHQDMLYNNCGSAIRGMDFRLIHVEHNGESTFE